MAASARGDAGGDAPAWQWPPAFKVASLFEGTLECLICHSELQRAVRMRLCGHAFCSLCLRRDITIDSPKCPACKQPAGKEPYAACLPLQLAVRDYPRKRLAIEGALTRRAYSPCPVCRCSLDGSEAALAAHLPACVDATYPHCQQQQRQPQQTQSKAEDQSSSAAASASMPYGSSSPPASESHFGSSSNGSSGAGRDAFLSAPVAGAARPTPNYKTGRALNLMKTKGLKDLLEAEGLPSGGNDDDRRWRYREYVHTYNSFLDDLLGGGGSGAMLASVLDVVRAAEAARQSDARTLLRAPSAPLAPTSAAFVYLGQAGVGVGGLQLSGLATSAGTGAVSSGATASSIYDQNDEDEGDGDADVDADGEGSYLGGPFIGGSFGVSNGLSASPAPNGTEAPTATAAAAPTGSAFASLAASPAPFSVGAFSTAASSSATSDARQGTTFQSGRPPVSQPNRPAAAAPAPAPLSGPDKSSFVIVTNDVATHFRELRSELLVREATRCGGGLRPRLFALSARWRSAHGPEVMGRAPVVSIAATASIGSGPTSTAAATASTVSPSVLASGLNGAVTAIVPASSPLLTFPSRDAASASSTSAGWAGSSACGVSRQQHVGMSPEVPPTSSGDAASIGGIDTADARGRPIGLRGGGSGAASAAAVAGSRVLHLGSSASAVSTLNGGSSFAQQAGSSVSTVLHAILPIPSVPLSAATTTVAAAAPVSHASSSSSFSSFSGSRGGRGRGRGRGGGSSGDIKAMFLGAAAAYAALPASSSSSSSSSSSFMPTPFPFSSSRTKSAGISLFATGKSAASLPPSSSSTRFLKSSAGGRASGAVSAGVNVRLAAGDSARRRGGDGAVSSSVGAPASSRTDVVTIYDEDDDDDESDDVIVISDDEEAGDDAFGKGVGGVVGMEGEQGALIDDNFPSEMDGGEAVVEGLTVMQEKEETGERLHLAAGTSFPTSHLLLTSVGAPLIDGVSSTDALDARPSSSSTAKQEITGAAVSAAAAAAAATPQAAGIVTGSGRSPSNNTPLSASSPISNGMGRSSFQQQLAVGTLSAGLLIAGGSSTISSGGSNGSGGRSKRARSTIDMASVSLHLNPDTAGVSSTNTSSTSLGDEQGASTTTAASSHIYRQPKSGAAIGREGGGGDVSLSVGYGGNGAAAASLRSHPVNSDISLSAVGSDVSKRNSLDAEAAPAFLDVDASASASEPSATSSSAKRRRRGRGSDAMTAMSSPTSPAVPASSLASAAASSGKVAAASSSASAAASIVGPSVRDAASRPPNDDAAAATRSSSSAGSSGAVSASRVLGSSGRYALRGSAISSGSDACANGVGSAPFAAAAPHAVIPTSVCSTMHDNGTNDDDEEGEDIFVGSSILSASIGPSTSSSTGGAGSGSARKPYRIKYNISLADSTPSSSPTAAAPPSAPSHHPSPPLPFTQPPPSGLLTLPPGWYAVRSKATGRPFYFDSAANAGQWTHPSHADSAHRAAAAAAAAAAVSECSDVTSAAAGGKTATATTVGSGDARTLSAASATTHAVSALSPSLSPAAPASCTIDSGAAAEPALLSLTLREHDVALSQQGGGGGGSSINNASASPTTSSLVIYPTAAATTVATATTTSRSVSGGSKRKRGGGDAASVAPSNIPSSLGDASVDSSIGGDVVVAAASTAAAAVARHCSLPTPTTAAVTTALGTPSLSSSSSAAAAAGRAPSSRRRSSAPSSLSAPTTASSTAATATTAAGEETVAAADVAGRPRPSDVTTGGPLRPGDVTGDVIGRRPGDWVCGVCTLINGRRRTKCSACDSPGP